MDDQLGVLCEYHKENDNVIAHMLVMSCFVQF